MTIRAGTMNAQMRPDSVDNQHLYKHITREIIIPFKIQNKCDGYSYFS